MVEIMKRLLFFVVPALLLLSLYPLESASAQITKVYWGEGGEEPDEPPESSKVRRANINGSSPDTLVTGQLWPNGMAVDADAMKIYWTTTSSYVLRRANLDGSSVENLVADAGTELLGVALDLTNNRIYVASVDDWDSPSQGKILWAPLNGGSLTDVLVVNGPGFFPRYVALDVPNTTIYFTSANAFDGPTAGKVQKVAFTGGPVTDLVTSLTEPTGIDLDLASSKMYWADTSTNKIQRANLNGSTVEDLVTSSTEPWGLALDLTNNPNKIYFTSNTNSGTTGKVQRANLTGSSVEDLVSNLNWSQGIALGPSGPTLVELVSFTAEACHLRACVLLRWQTAAEIDCAGFHLWRSGERSGPYVRINHALLPSEGSPSMGAQYTYEDADVEPGVPFWYKLEDIEYSGTATFHGPVSVELVSGWDMPKAEAAAASPGSRAVSKGLDILATFVSALAAVLLLRKRRS